VSFMSLRSVMSHRGMPLALILLAFVLTLPALRNGLTGDDLIFSCKLSEKNPIKDRGYSVGSERFGPATMSLFEWLNPQMTQTARGDGVLPWWTVPECPPLVWRPLSAARTGLTIACGPLAGRSCVCITHSGLPRCWRLPGRRTGTSRSPLGPPDSRH